jgi:hypothetical protein
MITLLLFALAGQARPAAPARRQRSRPSSGRYVKGNPISLESPQSESC